MKKIIIAFLLFCVVNTNAQINPTFQSVLQKSITVTGSAEIEVVPDEIYATIELREYKKKGENKTELDKIKENFLQKCKQVGVAELDIAVASYEGSNLSYWHWRKRRKDPDFYLGIVYEIKFKDTKKMDELVDILDDDATVNFYINKATYSKITEVRKQLKIQAVKAAKEKAMYLTEAVNENLGNAITIKEPNEINSDYIYDGISNKKYDALSSNIYYEKKTGGVANPYNSALNFKKIKLRFEVEVVFSLK